MFHQFMGQTSALGSVNSKSLKHIAKVPETRDLEEFFLPQRSCVEWKEKPSVKETDVVGNNETGIWVVVSMVADVDESEEEHHSADDNNHEPLDQKTSKFRSPKRPPKGTAYEDHGKCDEEEDCGEHDTGRSKDKRKKELDEILQRRVSGWPAELSEFLDRYLCETLLTVETLVFW